MSSLLFKIVMEVPLQVVVEWLNWKDRRLLDMAVSKNESEFFRHINTNRDMPRQPGMPFHTRDGFIGCCLNRLARITEHTKKKDWMSRKSKFPGCFKSFENRGGRMAHHGYRLITIDSFLEHESTSGTLLVALLTVMDTEQNASKARDCGIIDNKGKGNCLFEACLSFARFKGWSNFSMDLTPQQLRTLACENLLNNPLTEFTSKYGCHKSVTQSCLEHFKDCFSAHGTENYEGDQLREQFINFMRRDVLETTKAAPLFVAAGIAAQFNVIVRIVSVTSYNDFLVEMLFRSMSNADNPIHEIKTINVLHIDEHCVAAIDNLNDFV